MSETLHSAESDAGTAPRASVECPPSLPSWKIPGGGQICDRRRLRLCRLPDRAGGNVDPRHFRSAQAEDSLDHQPGASLVAFAQGARHRRHHGGQFRAAAAHRAAGGICRRRLSHLRHQGQDQSEAHQLREDARPRLSPLRSRRELRLHVDRDGRLMSATSWSSTTSAIRRSPWKFALVDAAAARGRRRDAASARQGASAASRDAQRRQDVRRLLAFGRRHRRRQRHQQAAHAWRTINTIRPAPSRRIRSWPCRSRSAAG